MDNPAAKQQPQLVKGNCGKHLQLSTGNLARNLAGSHHGHDDHGLMRLRIDWANLLNRYFPQEGTEVLTRSLSSMRQCLGQIRSTKFSSISDP